MNQMFYIISVWHTLRDHLYITFWRPDDRGYCWALSNAGKYDEAIVRAHLRYYNSGDKDIAVPCSVVDAMGISPIRGHNDNDAGPVIANNAENWKRLKAAVIAKPPYVIKPEYKGARRKVTA